LAEKAAWEELYRVAREAKEKAEQEAKEKAEREATERVEEEARVRAEPPSKRKKAKALAVREAKEKAEQEAREKSEQEAREKAEREAKEEAHERDKRGEIDREEGEREAKEEAKREAKEREEGTRTPASQFPPACDPTVGKGDHSRKASVSSQKNEWAGTRDLGRTKGAPSGPSPTATPSVPRDPASRERERGSGLVPTPANPGQVTGWFKSFADF